MGYYTNIDGSDIIYQQKITQIGLSCFFFASSYTLSKYNDFSNDERINSFLIKRAKRIYPLYWTAIITYIFVFAIFGIKTSVHKGITSSTITDYIANFIGIQQIGSNSHRKYL